MFEQVRNGGGIQERVFTAVGRARYQHTVNRQRGRRNLRCRSVVKCLPSVDRPISVSSGTQQSVETHSCLESQC